jgi:hypothetical protein
MASYVVWNMSAGGDGTWKTLDAEDARSAAELVCGAKLRSFGTESEICARVRALDPQDDAAVLFYAEKPAVKESKQPEPAAP